MKYIAVLLSIVSLTVTNTRYTEGGGVSVETSLKIIDTFPTGNCTFTIQEGDLVTFTSYGYLLDGRSFDAGTYESQIGNNEAPKGVDQGLRGLCYGDRRSMKIHSDWAYGEEGLDSRVPSNATVIYDVIVWDIERTVQERKGLIMNRYLKYLDTNMVENCAMKVQGGDKIYWHYIGTFTNGTEFDTGNFRATIDKGDVIRGVNQAMKGLCVGGKRNMTMHHTYAYGARGTENIPPYSNLVFQVYLTGIDRPGVGWEDFETKLRKASVSKENPIKTTDFKKTGDCEIKVSEGDIITWMRHGYLLDGKIFEEGSIETKIGDGKTIQSIEMALLGLCVADNRSLILHPDAAYGQKGLPGKVPSNATVIYDISILDIAKVKEGQSSYEGIEEETGLKPDQKLRIEVLTTVKNCTLKTDTGDTISWNYKGTFLDGTEFYSGTFKATLGRGEIIVGVDRGMRSMCIGEKRRLTIHSEWAYGNEGRPGSIPPKATLVFENELTNIERPVKTEL